MATVIVKNDRTASPDKITINAGETVTWEGDIDYEIHLPAPFTNPAIGRNGSKWSGTSNPFPGRAEKYSVHYAITAPGAATGNDPEVEVLP
jgi:plastocyanin